MKKIFMLFYTVLLSVMITSCGGGDNTSGNTTTTAVSNNLQSISSNFLPSSLDYSSGVNKPHTFLSQNSEDPCVGLDLFACQPILLKLYLNMGQMFLDNAREIISEIGSNIGDIPNGSSGTVTDGNETIGYSKASSTDFSILMKNNGSPAGYVDVNGDQYKIQLNLANMSDDNSNGEEETGKLDIEVSYTNDQTWTITIFIAGTSCQESDARAPERVRIQISRAGELWTGKAMLYNGRWFSGISDSSTPSCGIAESDEKSMNMYTDFVGNNIASKASVYMMSRTKSDLSDIANFGMDSLSTNFGISFNTSAYGNPFCNSTSDLIALWGDDCSSLDATVSSASYGSSSDWIAPNMFYQQIITLPTAL